MSTPHKRARTKHWRDTGATGAKEPSLLFHTYSRFRAHCKSVRQARDGFRESIIRLGVKIDNGLEKLNQGLKKAEKVKNSDQTLGSNLQTSVRATRSQRREARVRLVHSRMRLAFLRKIMAATSFVEEAASLNFCLFRIILRNPCRPLVFV